MRIWVNLDQTPSGYGCCFFFSYATEKLPDSSASSLDTKREVYTHTGEEEDEERREVRRPVNVNYEYVCVECVPHTGACLNLHHHVPKSALASALVLPLA